MPPLPDTTLRPIQIIWAAVLAGGATAAAVLSALGLQSAAPAVGPSETLFYANAGLNVAAILAAFALQRRAWERAAAATTDVEALSGLRSWGLVSLAVMEASCVAAGVCAFLTGEAVHILFALPFLAFGALFFPTRARVEALLALGRRPG